MENLTSSVYECTLAVEAHMICDLLARAGISARVDGEFLAGAGGELPLGSSVRVRVDPAREAEARAVIAEWEQQQPPPDTAPATSARRPRWRSPLWFAVGLAAGIGLSYWAHRLPRFQETVDVDGDGIIDETYTYNGHVTAAVEYDTNADGRPDQRWNYDSSGNPISYQEDGDFDGRFEWRGDVTRGFLDVVVKDADGDGRPERVRQSQRGRLLSEDIYDETGARVLIRERFANGRVVAREYDRDGDGVFEKRVDFDRYGEPTSGS